jgi:folate-binding protein YgfZ
MGTTALQASGGGLGAGVSEYRGATTAAHFGDPQAEFRALRTRCGVYDLGFRAKLSLAGSDRVRWLNGMVTNNIRDLDVGHGIYAFLLNPQGHILGDLFAYNLGESIMVDTDTGQAEKILATFDHYIIMDDVEISNLTEKLTALGISGPTSRENLTTAGLEIPELQPLQLQSVMWQGTECTLLRGEEAEYPAYEIWLAPVNVRKLWDALLSAGAVPVGSEALEMQRVASGIPRYGVDIRERDLPQETEQARALNFSKGCYVGQEIVERIRSRGSVHRKFTGFVADGTVQFAAGAKVVVGDKEVGEITSVASVQFPDASKTVALGYIRREVGIPGREVMVAGEKATVAQLPVAEASLSRDEKRLEQRPA